MPRFNIKLDLDNLDIRIAKHWSSYSKSYGVDKPVGIDPVTWILAELMQNTMLLEINNHFRDNDEMIRFREWLKREFPSYESDFYYVFKSHFVKTVMIPQSFTLVCLTGTIHMCDCKGLDGQVFDPFRRAGRK
jgi:hypothetical protein